jgi:hypothetical protein
MIPGTGLIRRRDCPACEDVISQLSIRADVILIRGVPQPNIPPVCGITSVRGIAYAPSFANRSVSSFLMVREIGFREIVPVSPEAKRQYALQVLLGPMSNEQLAKPPVAVDPCCRLIRVSTRARLFPLGGSEEKRALRRASLARLVRHCSRPSPAISE